MRWFLIFRSTNTGCWKPLCPLPWLRSRYRNESWELNLCLALAKARILSFQVSIINSFNAENKRHNKKPSFLCWNFHCLPFNHCQLQTPLCQKRIISGLVCNRRNRELAQSFDTIQKLYCMHVADTALFDFWKDCNFPGTIIEFSDSKLCQVLFGFRTSIRGLGQLANCDGLAESSGHKLLTDTRYKCADVSMMPGYSLKKTSIQIHYKYITNY